MTEMILDQKMRIFLEVVRQGGFRKTGRQLGMSQSAVSFHIDSLEKELGVSLFQRQGRTIALTEAGRFLQQRLEPLERDARGVMDAFAAHTHHVDRRIRLGGNSLTCPFALPWVIRGFRAEQPELVFNYTHARNEGGLLDSILAGDIDIGIFGHQIRQRKLGAHRCYDTDIILVAAAGFDLPESITAADIPDLPLILDNSDRGLELALSHGLQTAGVSLEHLNLVLETDNLPLIKTFLETGVGLSFLPRLTVMAELKWGTIKEIRVAGMDMRQTIHLLYRKSEDANPMVHKFIEFIELNAASILAAL
jgi:DNA-binding transcriptional LysR family regulator